jgi:formylmethanofuran dehydrogenase subunit E
MKKLNLKLSGNEADLLNEVLYDIRNDYIQKIRVRLVKTIRKYKIDSIRCENCGKKPKIFYTEIVNENKIDCCIPCSNKLVGDVNEM